MLAPDCNKAIDKVNMDFVGKDNKAALLDYLGVVPGYRDFSLE